MTERNPNCLHCRLHETIEKFRADLVANGQPMQVGKTEVLQSLVAVITDIVDGQDGDRMRLVMPHVLTILGSALPDNVTSGSITLLGEDGKVGNFDFTDEEEIPEVLQ